MLSFVFSFTPPFTCSGVVSAELACVPSTSAVSTVSFKASVSSGFS